MALSLSLSSSLLRAHARKQGEPKALSPFSALSGTDEPKKCMGELTLLFILLETARPAGSAAQRTQSESSLRETKNLNRILHEI
ncbi:hypothetical protein MA16_Dca027933 [Dendrobium catenatum]|uniref:Uncharacterized protein n=1 Tax=Dendrobium catenatum TaxID=906689 RepID=A0A2I0VAQ3_9ASPA|nr:hypothetical protein MA16_Dca027933 [Dendrobium catenatum]